MVRWLMVSAYADSAIFRGNFQQKRKIPEGPILDCSNKMESRIIGERAFRFACRTVKLFERLWSQGPAARKVAGQLFKCGTSIGANTAESQGGQTKPDFVAKPVIARKE